MTFRSSCRKDPLALEPEILRFRCHIEQQQQQQRQRGSEIQGQKSTAWQKQRDRFISCGRLCSCSRQSRCTGESVFGFEQEPRYVPEKTLRHCTEKRRSIRGRKTKSKCLPSNILEETEDGRACVFHTCLLRGFVRRELCSVIPVS